MALIDPSTPAGVMPVGDTTSQYTLTFSDEFNAASLDPKWTVNIDWYTAVGPAEQNYDTNASGNSALRIWPPVNTPTSTYNSHGFGSDPDRVFHTRSSFSQIGGYWEAKIQCPIGNACWPAFWNYQTPVDSEQDFMEAYNQNGGGWGYVAADGYIHPNNYGFTLHDFNGNTSYQITYANPPPAGTGNYPDLAAQYYIYGCRWDANSGAVQQYLWWYDSNNVLQGGAWGSGATWGPKNAQFAMLDLAFGGAAAAATASDPPRGSSNSMKIDWVRVWQIGGSGTPAPGPSPGPGGTSAPNLDTTTPHRVQPVGDYTQNWTINFSDEFNTAALDSSRWSDLWPSDTSHLAINYDINVQSSALRIWPPSINANSSFAAGSFYADPARTIHTIGKYHQTYGCFEIRVKANKGTYCVANFWLYDDTAVSGASFIDVDRFQPGDTTDAYAAINGSTGIGYPIKTLQRVSNDSGAVSTTQALANADFSADYHILRISWDSSNMSGYLDGALKWTIPTPTVTQKSLILSLTYENVPTQYGAVTNTDPPRGSANSMEVDYVRTWTNISLTPVSLWTGLIDPLTSIGVQPVGQTSNLYKLEFSDEFALDTLNTNLWSDYLSPSTSDKVINYDTNRNANGILSIWPDAGFVPRTITTKGKVSLGYGYYEISAKLLTGKGPVPTFSMANFDTAAQPFIDIVKAFPGGFSTAWANAALHPTAYQSNVWTDIATSNLKGAYKKLAGVDLSAAFHTYAVRYDQNTVQFYFDGTLTQSFSNPWAANTLFFFILQLSYGSSSGTADSTTPISTPNSFQIAYIRGWSLISAPAGIVPAAGGGYNTTFNIFRNNRYR